MSPRVAVAAVALPVCCLVLVLAAAAEKTVATATGENDDVVVTMTLHLDPADIKNLVTSDLGGHFILAEVKVTPKYGKEVTVSRDDFLLMDVEHNDRSKPFAANQIVGPALIVQRGPDDSTEKKDAKGKKARPRITGPIMTSPGVKLDDPAKTDPSQAKSHEDDAEKDSPLEKALDARMLPEGKGTQPSEGLLFFAFDKPRMKDLELSYGAKVGRITLHFR
jgi:hypothetical protein